MPNWIRNRLVIKGKNASQIFYDKYVTVNEKGEENFDFNKVIECPKELEDTPYSSDTPKEVYQRNKAKYGYEQWYDWRVAYWGTKWNACETEINTIDNDTIEISFETAWHSIKLSFIEEMSNQCKGLEFEIWFADEDIGSNVGHSITQKGFTPLIDYPKPLSKQAYELAFEMWDCKNEYIFNEDKGTYEYNEDY